MKRLGSWVGLWFTPWCVGCETVALWTGPVNAGKLEFVLRSQTQTVAVLLLLQQWNKTIISLSVFVWDKEPIVLSSTLTSSWRISSGAWVPGAFLSLCQTVHYVSANEHGASCKGLERTDKQYPSFLFIYIFPAKEADSNLCAKRTTLKKNPQYHKSRDKNCSQRHPRHDKTVWELLCFNVCCKVTNGVASFFVVRFSEGDTYSAVHHCPQDSVSPKSHTAI